MTEYGAKGCACWRSEDYNPWDDRTHHDWMPNARCRFHGLLADYTPPRNETGTYRVDLSTPPDGPECPPGVHSMFDFCPGGCTLAYDEDAALLAREDLQESLAQLRRGEVVPAVPRRRWWRHLFRRGR